MKTKKLKLNDVKVESFITELKHQNQDTLNGGAQYTGCRSCVNSCWNMGCWNDDDLILIPPIVVFD